MEMSPELLALAGPGFDPSMITDSDGGSIYVGTRQQDEDAPVDGFFSKIARRAGRPDPILGKAGDDETKSITEYEKEFYKLPPGELPTLQRRLFEGGFYDQSMEWDDVRVGDHDEYSQKAWKRALERAAALYGADQKQTLDQVIENARGKGAKNGPGGSGGGSKKPPLSVQVSHPDDIRNRAMKISSETLGRGWNADELDRFVETYQQMERAAQASAHGANYAGGTTTAAPSVDTAVERAARQGNPVAAGGTDVANAYKMVLDAIGNLGAK